MIVTLKYFGLIAEITNKKEEKLQLEQHDFSVAFLKSKIESVYEGLQNASYAIAVNQSFCHLDSEIKDNDVIAFLPPFAGG